MNWVVERGAADWKSCSNRGDVQACSAFTVTIELASAGRSCSSARDFAWLWDQKSVIVLAVPTLVTNNVRVNVESHYSPERSNAARGLWFFLYNIVITNEGPRTVRLVSRHWVITDAHGKVEEVRGPGVVGKEPQLEEGQAFRYTSGCPLRTPFGSMQGSYQMVTLDGDSFEVAVPPFALRDPKMMQ